MLFIQKDSMEDRYYKIKDDLDNDRISLDDLSEEELDAVALLYLEEIHEMYGYRYIDDEGRAIDDEDRYKDDNQF